MSYGDRYIAHDALWLVAGRHTTVGVHCAAFGVFVLIVRLICYIYIVVGWLRVIIISVLHRKAVVKPFVVQDPVFEI